MWRFRQSARSAKSQELYRKESENIAKQQSLLEHCGDPPRFDLGKFINKWKRESPKKPSTAPDNILNTTDQIENCPVIDQTRKQLGFIGEYGAREVENQLQAQLQAQLQLQREEETIERIRANAHPEDKSTDMMIHYAESDMGLFGRLSGELRNTIYRLVCVAPAQPHIVESYERECCRGKCAHSSITAITSGLSNTCRSIRHEMMPIFVAENDFKFENDAVRNRCVGNWIKTLGPYSVLLKNIQMDFPINTRYTAIPMADVGSVTITRDASLVPKTVEEIKQSVVKTRSARVRFLQFEGHGLVIKCSPNVPLQCIKKSDLKESVLDLVHSTENYDRKVAAFVDSDGLADLLFWCRK